MFPDIEAANDFSLEFDTIALSYDERDIYNGDEAGLLWRALPEDTLVTREEKKPAGYKPAKERVTLMVCGNAAGTHKVPLFMIGKTRKPRCWRSVPENYAAQPSAWMSAELFVRWYDEIFIPSVENQQLAEGRVAKVLLLLDNAPVHPAANPLERQGGFTVRYLPANVTSLLQPMDQVVIATLKRNYRRGIL